MPALVPEPLGRILAAAPALQAAYLVGGCVRDWVLGIPSKDYDIEVFGISYDQLIDALAPFGRTDLVGKSFGVIKLTTPGGVTYDFTIPRRDSKVAPGHKGFTVTFDPSITPREAASRRDFTINSLMFDPRQGTLMDFFGGREDLQNRVLRHTSASFHEDPLRVLRGMQFASRFRLTATSETIELCRQMRNAFSELPGDRVRDEWFKWAEKSVAPSSGLKFLAATSWWDHFPELKAMDGVRQDPEWHPEGDVFVHTGHCCDAMTQLQGWQTADPESKIVHLLAVLLHDAGKPVTTQEAIKNGRLRIVSPGHDEVGGSLAESFLQRIHCTKAIAQRVVPLVVNHLAHLQPITDRSVRRLASRLAPSTIHELSLVMTADHFGRPPIPAVVPESILALEAKAAELELRRQAPTPILLGRHFIELGLAPGPEFGVVLRAAFEAQLEGAFENLDQARRWLLDHHADKLTPQACKTLRSRLPP